MRTYTQVVTMLARLHQLGYQRLRLSSGISRNGAAWRISVAPVKHFQNDGFMLLDRYYPGTAFTNARDQDEPPFGWHGGSEPDPDQLAARFVESFPEVAAAGLGKDAEYASWFAEMLEQCGPEDCPIMYGEYLDAATDGYFEIAHDKRVPLPPAARGRRS